MELFAYPTERYMDQSHIIFTRSEPSLSTYITIDLTKVLENYEEEISMVEPELGRAIHTLRPPEWWRRGNEMTFIKETVEGQHLLEYAISECVGIVETPLFLGKPRGTIAGLRERWESDETTFTFEKPEIDVNKRFHELTDTHCSSYIYTISVVDSNDVEFYYVGKSENPMSRLKRHVSIGGDFAEAKRRGETYVRKIHSIKPSSEITEQRQYCHVRENNHEPVFGGK